MNTYPVGVSLEEAFELIFGEIMNYRTEAEAVDVLEAVGRIAAENIISKENIPAFDKSPYDGYAFKSSDTKDASQVQPVRLKILEEIPAGSWPKYEVHSGEASKILTGAPVPEGADAVIPYENTHFTDTYVDIMQPYKSDCNVIHAGEDIGVGDIVICRGQVMDASNAAMLAGLGISKIPVQKKLKTAILCTGSELIDIDEQPGNGKIRNTNYYLLAGELLEQHMLPVNEGMTEDNPKRIAKKLQEALAHCDCVITTGGASVGDYDVMKEAAELAGGRLLFWKIRMKPGSAAATAIIQGKPVFILSGNPAAAAVTFHMLVLPILRRMSGYRCIYPRRYQVRMLETFKKASPNRRFVRGRMIIKNGEVYFAAGNKQGNNMVSSMSECELFADIPAGSGSIPEGELVFAWDLKHMTDLRGMNL